MPRDRANLSVWSLVALAGLACCWASPAAMAQAEEEAGEAEAAGDVVPAATDEDEIEISDFTEPLDLAILVEFVADALSIDITVQGELTGQVTFVSPRTIPRAELLPLLERLLDQHNFALMYDAVLDRYLVRPTAAVSGGGAGGEFSTTRIIPTPNIRPSSLLETLTAYSTAVGGIGQISYLDDIGVVVVTGPPIRARETEAYIQSLVEQAKRIEYIRFNLTHLSASTARERAIALATGNASSGQLNIPGRNNDNQSNLRSGSSFDNLADRLSAERHSNSLIFRGLPEEAERVRSLIELIDQPTNLNPREFFAGSLAAQVARIASGLGLGEVVEIDEEDDLTQANRAFQRVNPNNPLGGDSTDMTGGSLMIVDAQRGMIIHYGTPEQQEQLESLVLELKADGERIVIREYKLENATAEVIADLLQALVDGGNDQSDGTLLPGVSRPNQVNRAQPNTVGGGDGSFTAQAEDVYVGFFEPQNMVLVKAPAEVQSQFEELIERLDQRSPQVFLDVQIVSVTNSEDFRFAVESQIIAGQYGLQTNFGLSTASDDGFLNRRSPSTSLPGLTTALIRSEAMPFVINAIETQTDGKVISRPQLLVNDNAEASIVSEEQQPTTSTSQGDGSTVTSFQGFESAGTQLRVKPVISSGGYVRLEYEIELSNFIGTGGNGIPAPKNVRNVTSEAITVPGDSTIVVGGINVADVRKTKTGIPLLMDIPLVGDLLSDTRDISSESLLYIFITPRIMRDDNFRDLRLQTAGPQSEVNIPEDMPSMSPVFMDGVGLTPPPNSSAVAPAPTSTNEAPSAPADEPTEWPEQRPATMTPVSDSD